MNRLSQGLSQTFRPPAVTAHLRTLLIFPTPPPPHSSRTPSTFIRTRSNPRKVPPSTYPTFPTPTSTPPSRLFSVTEEEDVVVPPPPTNCCMSGCTNCVWITYAQELAAIYKDKDRASEKVMKAIDDPSLKIFLSLELKELLEDSESE